MLDESELTIESVGAGQTGLFKEVVRISDERVATNDLNQVHHDRNLCPGEVAALEAVKIRRRGLHLLLEQICLLDADQHLLNLGAILGRGESQQRLSGVFLPALANEPVRGLGSKR